MMETERLAGQAAKALEARLGQERVLLPGGRAYDEAVRIWNGAVEHRPALIARCETAADVRATVREAGAQGLPLSVLGAGNDWAGRALRDGGLVVDLTRMRVVNVAGRGRHGRGRGDLV